MRRAPISKAQQLERAQNRMRIRLAVLHDPLSLAWLLHKDRTPNHLDPTGRMKPSALHYALARHMKVDAARTRENLYLISRDHFKTTFITVVGTVWRILRHPRTRTLIMSHKAEAAQGMLTEIKAALTHPALVAAFPDILYAEPGKEAHKWTETLITVKGWPRTKEHTVECIGLTGDVTGKHFDHITFDDVVSKENSATRESRMDVIQAIRLSRSLLDDPATSGRTMVGTPWHHDDAWAWKREQIARGLPIGQFIRPCWTADASGEDADALAVQLGLQPGGFGRVRITFPERFTLQDLLLIRDEKGPAEFAAQYLLNPVSADTVRLPREKIHRVRRDELPPLDSLWKIMTVDPAISVEKYADRSAIVVAGFDRNNDIWILDLRAGKWRETELISQVYAAWAQTPGIMAVGWEAIGFQKVYGQLFAAEGERRGFWLPMLKLPRESKRTKNTRIQILEPHWQAGRIHALADCPGLEILLDEADKWHPDVESAHDDCLDALADTFELRQRPALIRSEARNSLYEDPERAERAQFEQRLLTERPYLDGSALAMAWLHEQRRRVADQAQEYAAVGGGGEEWAI